MGATRACVSAVVAGAMTAGIGAVPEKSDSPEPRTADVALAAAPVEIPIIDIGPTPGPLSIWRELSVLVGLDPLTAGLIQHAGNTYDLPGLMTTVDATTNILVQAIRQPGEYIDFGLASDQSQLG